MLVALCEPGAYGGGGTAFWSEEAAAPATEEVAPKPNPNPNPNPNPDPNPYPSPSPNPNPNPNQAIEAAASATEQVRGVAREVGPPSRVLRPGAPAR